MTFIERIARIESKIRPLLTILPPYWMSMFYSSARKRFLSMLYDAVPNKSYQPPDDQHRKIWDICFGSKLLNAAGMFKNGRGYTISALQGAAGFLVGTTTLTPRKGNRKSGILHPFLPYPRSGAASNWMGLPNEGHAVVAKRLAAIPRKKHCPIGASLSADPEAGPEDAISGIIEGMQLYEKAAIEFFELNESCPNVPHDKSIDKTTGLDSNLLDRLEQISKGYLKRRQTHIPVVVKFSLDTDKKHIKPLIDALVNFGFDGINLGNTSINYALHRPVIDTNENEYLDYFTQRFGGGLSGRPLKAISLELARHAADYIKEINPGHEFHVIRTGGISDPFDLQASENAGISLNQWFTGYFEIFAGYGHNVYRHMLNCKCI